MVYIGAEYLSSNYFGTGHGIPTLTNWRCIGNETNLLDCLHTNDSSCAHHRAGVKCIGEVVTGILDL